MAAKASGAFPADGQYLPGAVVTGPAQGAGIVLICEHASAAIPDDLAGLGLAPQDRLSHAVWDIGALDIAEAMRDALDAPLIAGATSRLVYDCNRPPEADSAIPAQSERIAVPGNRDLTAAQRAARAARVYTPFSAAVAAVIAAQDTAPAIVTLHSFTPVWHGQPRATELGLLHDDDPALAETMLRLAPAHVPLRAELNAPYAASDGVTHTLRRYATAAGLPSVMIEVRNDLVATAADARRIGTALAALIRAALTDIGHQMTRPEMHTC
jgi:predicted N-formylglutamate amidohydrolase